VGMIRSILATEGPVGLYAGITAPLLAVVPAYGIAFWTFDTAKSAMLSRGNNSSEQGGRQQPHQLTVGQTALAGAASGVPVALLQGPLEKVKCEFQLNSTKYASLEDCLRQSYRRGIGQVFRGTGLTIARDVPGNAAFFATYEVSRQALCQLEGRYYYGVNNDGSYSKKPSMAATLAAGGLAGMANWIVAIPMDVIKSRYQTAAPGTYASSVDVVRQLLRADGARALFRGLGPALMRAVPSNAAGLLGVETARTILQIDNNYER